MKILILIHSSKNINQTSIFQLSHPLTNLEGSGIYSKFLSRKDNSYIKETKKIQGWFLFKILKNASRDFETA